MTTKIGRPLRFESPAALQALIDGYFAEHEGSDITLTGLCLGVGVSKQLLNDYQKRDGYDEVVTIAKLRVENAYEISLRKHGRSGDIFALKNFGWKDVQEQRIDANVVQKIEYEVVDPSDSGS